MASEESLVLQQGLSNLTKTISPHIQRLSSSTVSFREAADRHNKNISNILGDVSSAIFNQRKHLSDVSESLEESSDQIQKGFAQSSREAEATNNTLSQLLSAQYRTLSELSDVNRNLISIANNTSSGILTNIFNGIFSGKLFIDALKIGLGVTAAGAVVGAAVGGLGGSDYKMTGGEQASGSQIVSGLTSRGFSKEEAAGLAGNISAESNFKTDATNSIGAFGLMQWLGKRKAELFEFAKSQNKSPTDLNIQLDFIKKELKGGGYETEQFDRAVKESGGDVSKLAYNIGKYVERPSSSELAESSKRRVGVATSLYKSAGEINPTSEKNTAQNVSTPQSSTTQNVSTPQSSTTQNVSTPQSSTTGASLLSKFNPISSAQAAETPHNHATPTDGATPQSSTNAAAGPVEKASADARTFLQSRQTGGSGFSGVHADKLDSTFADRLMKAIQAAEKATGSKVGITEGYRDPHVQAQYYSDYIGKPLTYDGKTYQPDPSKFGRLAAPPGRSNHQKGMAADLAASPAREWIRVHASEFGLQQLGSKDMPHFELAGASAQSGTGSTAYTVGPSGNVTTPSSGGGGETTPSTSGGASNISPQMMPYYEMGQQLGMQLKEQMSSFNLGTSGLGGGMGLGGMIPGLGGMGSMLESVMSLVGSPTSSMSTPAMQTAEQIPNQLTTAKQIQSAAVEKESQINKEQTIAKGSDRIPESGALTQSSARHFAQGDFYDYNHDRDRSVHAPGWWDQLHHTYGRVAGGNNIKTHIT